MNSPTDRTGKAAELLERLQDLRVDDLAELDRDALHKLASDLYHWSDITARMILDTKEGSA